MFNTEKGHLAQMIFKMVTTYFFSCMYMTCRLNNRSIHSLDKIHTDLLVLLFIEVKEKNTSL